MKTRYSVATTLLAVACVMLVGAQAFSATISVNVDSWTEANGFDEHNDPMPAEDIAGVVPSANWNAFGGGGFQGVTPVDDSGAAVPGLVITDSVGGNDSWNTNGSNNVLMFGDFSGSGDMDISGVPYASYDLIVYAKKWDPVQNFSVDGGATVQTITNLVNGNMENPQSFDKPDWSNGVFADGVHYTTFAGLSGDVTLTHGSMSGFQIVEAAAAVPEPGTAVLLGLGCLFGFGAFTRRRR